jgi:hypothetical protein
LPVFTASQHGPLSFDILEYMLVASTNSNPLSDTFSISCSSILGRFPVFVIIGVTLLKFILLMPDILIKIPFKIMWS